MTVFYWIILISLFILFMATGILTLLALVRFGPKKIQVVTIDPKYLERLFVSLILEVVILGITIGGWAVANLQKSIISIDQSSAEITQAIASIDDIATSHIINEPSGLVAFEKNGIHGLVVDDQESNLFVLAPTKNGLRFKRTISFRGVELEDLESITWDRRKWFYAATSFRQLGDEGKRSRNLLRFELREDWTETSYEITPETRDISDKLAVFLSAKGVNINKKLWMQKAAPNKEWHPWMLEIEGLAVCNGQLLLGLKWPLTSKGDAIVVSYSWADNEFKNLYPLALDNKGISDLAYLPQQRTLLVAANPPAKERKENKTDEQQHLGKSSIYIFSWAGDAQQPTLRHPVHSIARRGAKLEGVTLIGEEIWLAYDGPNHRFDRKPASILNIRQ